MKKILSTLLFSFLISTTVQAAGFSGQSSKITVIEALKLPDDSYVTVQGSIVRRISSDKYLFKDKSGTMTVEIDDDKWGNIEANDKDVLELSGEIEKKLNSVHLDVDTIKKVN